MKQMRTALCWVTAQRAVVISLPGNYHYSLRNNLEEDSSRIIRCFPQSLQAKSFIMP